MARIPRLNSNIEQITSGGGINKVNGGSPQLISNPFEGIGKAISNVGDMIEHVRGIAEKTQAKNILDKGLMDLQTQALNDPDTSKERQSYYTDQIAKVKQDASGALSIPMHRDQFGLEADNDINLSKVKIQTIFGKKTIYKAIVNSNENLSLQEQAFVNASTPDERKSILEKTYASLDYDVRAGLRTADEAAGISSKLSGKFNKALLTSDVGRDNSSNIDDSFVYNQLKLGEKGAYGDLTPEERGEGLDNIQKKVRRNQILFTFQQNQNQDKNEAQMLVDATDGKLNPEQVKDGLLGQGVRRSFGEKMLKKVYGNPNPDTDYSVYNKVRDMQLTDATPKEINDFILDNSDKLSNNDKKFLIDKTFSEVDKKQKTTIRYNADALKNWAKDKLSLMPQVSSDLIYEFHRRVNQSNAQGAAIDAIAQELQKEKIKELYPPTALLQDVPNFTADRNRLRKVYEKESKLKGKSNTNQKPANINAVSSGVNFDDL